VNSTWYEADESILIFVLKRDAYFFCHLPSKHMCVMHTFLRCSLPAILNPNAIDNGMENLPTILFCHVDGLEQNVPRPCTNGFMCLNAAEPSVLVTSVTKACDEQPFESVLLLIESVTFLTNKRFQEPSALNEGCNDAPEKTMNTCASMRWQTWHWERL
jgi:hypothetical protein